MDKLKVYEDSGHLMPHVSDLTAQQTRTRAIRIFQTPSERGLAFRVPQIAVRVHGELRCFDDPEVLHYPWDRPRYVALPSAEEESCARELERFAQRGDLEFWMRNLVRDGEGETLGMDHRQTARARSSALTAPGCRAPTAPGWTGCVATHAWIPVLGVVWFCA